MEKIYKKLVGLVLVASLFCFPMVALGADTVTEPYNLDHQMQVEKDILAEFAGGEYDLDDPLVKLDPYGWSPLTALVLFDTPQAATVEITVKGKDEHTTIKHDFESLSTHHEIPVYGLYPGKKNDVTLEVKYENGKTDVKQLEIQTAALPKNDFITADVVTCDPGQVEDGLTFMVPPIENANRPSAIDQNGDVRWYLDNKIAGLTGEITRLANGHLLLNGPKLDTLYKGYYNSSFYEMDLSGKIYKEFLRNGLHHDIEEMPNGDLIVVTNKVGRDTVEDYMVILDRKTGMVKDSLDLKEIFKVWQQNPDDPDEITPDPTWNSKEDWFHQNAVWYNAKDNSILITGRRQDACVKIDVATKKVVWILADPNNDYWPDDLKDKLLTPLAGDKDFEYQYGQHAVMQLPNGDIFLFDNGNFRSKDPATAIPVKSSDNYSRAVIYRVNEKDKTVEQIWQYGKERGTELYSPYICDVDYLGEGHYLIDFGGVGGFGKGVPGIGTSCSRIIEIKNDKVIGETVITKVDESGKNLNANSYRIERMEAYTDQDQEYELGIYKGQTLGKLFKAGDVETPVNIISANATGNGGNFGDINNHWAKSDIDYVVAKGLYKGVTATEFAPDVSLNRAMVVTVLSRVNGADTSKFKNNFNDIPGSDWYANPVSWASTLGIVNGVGNNKFAPLNDVTREQLAAIFVNYLKYKGYDLSKYSGDGFKDDAQVSSWAKASLDIAQGMNLISGRADGSFDPQGKATRAEGAALFTRLMKFMENK